MSLRSRARALLDNRLRRLRSFGAEDWLSSAMIIAPHPDDETLGCGGIACKKILAGAAVSFVFVTDGGSSHFRGIGREELIKTRETEAREAVLRLGGGAEEISFLRYPDSEASGHMDQIAADVLSLLQQKKPQSVFIPHAMDFPSDHTAVNAATVEALRIYGQPVTMYEYPIWYWYHWPWISLSGDLPGRWRISARQTLRTRAGLGILSALNRRVYIGDVLEIKRAALAAHKSQTRRPESDGNWVTLGDLAGGEFVARLLSDYETFSRYEVNQ